MKKIKLGIAAIAAILMAVAMIAFASSSAFADGSSSPSTSSYPTGAPTPAPSGPTCVQSPKFSYTYDGSLGGGVITVTGGAAGELLCKSLAVRATNWSYVLPTTGANPSWPQDKPVYVDTLVNAIGVFPYGTSGVGACKQNDAYASFSGFSALNLPAELTGPGKPFEPTFLSSLISGGPVTYSTTPSTGCNTPPVPTSSATATLGTVGNCYADQNGTSLEAVSVALANTGSTPVTFTSPNGINITLPAGESKVVSVTPVSNAGETFSVTASYGTTFSKVFTITVPDFASCSPIVVTAVIPPAPTCTSQIPSDALANNLIPEPDGVTVLIKNGYVYFGAAPGYVLSKNSPLSYKIPADLTFTDCHTPPKSTSTNTVSYSTAMCNYVVTETIRTVKTSYIPNATESAYVSVTTAPVTTTTQKQFTATELTALNISQPTGCATATASGLAYTGSPDESPWIYGALAALLAGLVALIIAAIRRRKA